MGSKLEKVRDMVKETGTIGDAAIKEADSAVSDITSVRDILGEMPSDMDDDLIDCSEQVADAATNEATSFMESDVQSQIEKGEDIGNEANDQAVEQAGLSHEAADKFHSAAGIRFGETGSDAASKAETSAENFEQQSEEVSNVMEQNRSLYESALDKIRRR